MKTIVPELSRFKKSVMLLIAAASLSTSATAQVSGGTNGLNFDNYTLQSGTALQVGARYLFSNVDNNTDAVVTLDSLVNGAKLNKIDDNSNGIGYKQAFQPAVQSGNVIGYSYAVFTISFFEHNTTTPKSIATVNATALDLDGNSTLKEFARINVGNGGTTNYMTATPDISVTSILLGDFMGQNILGIERNGIDTSALANMFTATNTGISSFSVKYGTFTTVPSSSVRQYSLYMKGFAYPPSTLPVKLTSFTATLNNSKADLKWITATEINASHFVIERSFDGINFTQAGLMFATGNSTEKVNYSFSDNLMASASSVVWYRLVSVDMDGKTELSETRIIWLNKQKEAEVSIVTFPNPASSEIRITVPANWQNKPVVYELFNMGGQVVRRIQNANSSQTETISLTGLGSGVYVAKVTCEGQSAKQRIVKQ